MSIINVQDGVDCVEIPSDRPGCKKYAFCAKLKQTSGTSGAAVYASLFNSSNHVAFQTFTPAAKGFIASFCDVSVDFNGFAPEGDDERDEGLSVFLGFGVGIAEGGSLTVDQHIDFLKVNLSHEGISQFKFADSSEVYCPSSSNLVIYEASSGYPSGQGMYFNLHGYIYARSV